MDERQKVLKGVNEVGLIRRPSFMSCMKSSAVVLTYVTYISQVPNHAFPTLTE